MGSGQKENLEMIKYSAVNSPGPASHPHPSSPKFGLVLASLRSPRLSWLGGDEPCSHFFILPHAALGRTLRNSTFFLSHRRAFLVSLALFPPNCTSFQKKMTRATFARGRRRWSKKNCHHPVILTLIDDVVFDLPPPTISSLTFSYT